MPKPKQSPPPEPAEGSAAAPGGYITNDPDHPVALELPAHGGVGGSSRLVDQGVLLSKVLSVIIAFAVLFYLFLA